MPSLKNTKAIGLGGLRGVHSEWVYKTLESAHDVIIEFKLDERGRGIKNMMRIRSIAHRTLQFRLAFPQNR